MIARTALFHGAGLPLELREHSMPEPAGAELLVRISACTLCRSDLHTHSGRRSQPLPSVLGHEIVGRIAAFGPNARPADHAGSPAGLGDRITWAVVPACGDCFFCRHDLEQKCATGYKYGHVRSDATAPGGGGLADYLLLQPGTAWFRVPEALPDGVAAMANCSTATAVAVVERAGGLEDGTVVIYGAGVLGLTAAALAAARGARHVVVCDPDAGSRTRALQFRATHTAAGQDELAELVRELTDGRGADAALELCGAPPAVVGALEVVRIGGTVVLAGTVAPTPPIPLDPEAVVRKVLTVTGVHNYRPHDLGAALQFLAGPGAALPFAELVQGTFPLAEVEQAMAFAHAHPGSRCLVVP